MIKSWLLLLLIITQVLATSRTSRKRLLVKRQNVVEIAKYPSMITSNNIFLEASTGNGPWMGLPVYPQQIQNVLDPSRRVTMSTAFSRFGMLQGSLTLRVTLKKGQEKIGTIRLGRAKEPQPAQPMTTVSNSTHLQLQFTILAAGNYYLKLAESNTSPSTTLFLYVDTPDQVAQDANMRKMAQSNTSVISIASLGAQTDSDVTTLLQSAIIQLQGKTIFIPAGLYRTNPLLIKSIKSLSIYLEAGAVLRGIDGFMLTPTGYQVPQADTVETMAFIFIGNSENISISGRGMIHANAYMKMAYKPPFGVHGVHVYRSKSVSMEGIMFQGSSSWGLHLNQSVGFTGKNLKWYSGKDVYNIDGSQQVEITNSVGFGVDDGLVVKFNGVDDFRPRAVDPPRVPVKNVRLANNVIVSSKSSLKIGTETKGAFSNVLFEGNHVVDGCRGIVIVAVDGGSVTNATYLNNRLYMTTWPSESWTGTVMQFCNGCMGSKFLDGTPRPVKPTPVHAVVDGLYTNVIASSLFEGQINGPLNLVVKNSIFDVLQPKSSLRATPYLFTKSNDKIQGSGVNVKIQDSIIRWNGNQKYWRISDGGSWLKLVNINSK